MNHSYILAPGKPRNASIPLVKVIYKNGSKSSPPMMTLVDSGAQISFAPLDLAVWLGVKVDHKKPLDIGGFNGAVTTCYPGKLTVEVDGEDYNITVYFGGNANLSCILGQDPFFDMVKVTFERYSDFFSLEKV